MSQSWDSGRPDRILGCLASDKPSLPSAERSPRQEAVGRGYWASDPVLPCMIPGYFQISNEKPFGRNGGCNVSAACRNSDFKKEIAANGKKKDKLENTSRRTSYNKVHSFQTGATNHSNYIEF